MVAHFHCLYSNANGHSTIVVISIFFFDEISCYPTDSPSNSTCTHCLTRSVFRGFAHVLTAYPCSAHYFFNFFTSHNVLNWIPDLSIAKDKAYAGYLKL